MLFSQYIKWITFAGLLLSSLLVSGWTTAAVFGAYKIEPHETKDEVSSEFKVLLPRNTIKLPVFDVPDQQAKVEQQILFSRQDGSWMFQSLVNNGLFEIASGYQPHHPRALLLKDGETTLEQLHKAVSDEAVLAKHGDKFLLYYPLIIEPSAVLKVNKPLELVSEAGAALINRGQLLINSASVSTRQKRSANFRSFILSWNGSLTSVNNSELSNLGYDGYLSSGLTLTAHEKSAKQDTGVLIVENSTITNVFVGITSTEGRLFVKNNRFANSHRAGLDIRNSEVLIQKNTIHNVRSGHGIRLVDNTLQSIIRNDIREANKSGILLSGVYGQSQVIGNKIQDNGDNGLWLEMLQYKNQKSIEVKGNVIANNQLSGIKTNCFDVCMFASNMMIGNKRYGFNLENLKPVSHQLVLQDNYFRLNTLASVQTLGLSELVLADNRFFFDTLQSKVFVGELEPHQSLIQKSLTEQKQRIRITKEQVQ